MIDLGPPPLVFSKPAIIRPATEDLLKYGGPVTSMFALGGPGIQAGKRRVEAFDASFVNKYTSTSDTNAYTFSTCDIGAASGTRLVAVVALARDTNPVALSSATIGGSAADIRVSSSTSAGRAGAAIFARLVTTGTTADIVVTWDEAVTNCVIYVFRIVGYASAVPSDTFVNSTAVGSTSRVYSIDTVSGGAVIGGQVGAADGGAKSIDVGAISSQEALESNRFVGWLYFPSSAATPNSITVSGSSTEDAWVAATWDPP